MTQTSKPNLDHPTLAVVKAKFPGVKFLAAEFRDQTTLVVARENFHDLMAFLRDDPACKYDFLSDVVGIDYLKYPAAQPIPGAIPGSADSGRFAVVYNLVSYEHNLRLFVKVLINPTLDTSGVAHDPALELPTVTDLWPGAEWTEREVFDMLGIRFTNHPDLRRILLWDAYPAYPLRKDYPLQGRGEREAYDVTSRDSA